MPIKVKRLYLDTIIERYQNAPKSEKSQILTEFCYVCRYSRKYAIRILRGTVEVSLYKPGPKPRYTPIVIEHLRQIWESMNRPCGKNLKASLPLWLDHYSCDSKSKNLLLQMSAATMDRVLSPFKRVRGLSLTRESVLKTRIPIRLLDGEVTKPGYVEVDTVAHCGESAYGPFISSLTITDLKSAWTENRAIFGKQADNVVKSFKAIEERLPFILRGVASDNGSEFVNEQLEEYLRLRLIPVEFVRRRAYKKNDNAHVEQKNFTHVRELFGWRRFDHPELVARMNEIYQAYWNPLQNYFMANQKLKTKIREGSKIKKYYGPAKTPAQRLLEDPEIPNHIKRRLRDNLDAKNPFYLKQELDRKLKEFFELVDKLKRESLVPA
jgi:hypothetical protein